MKRAIQTAAVACSILWLASTAFAGDKASGGEVFLTIATATGSVAAARASADSVQYIGCSVQATAPGYSGAGINGTCTAVNSAGSTLTCTTTDAGVLQAIGTIGVDSYIKFTVDSTTGHCVNVTITNNSKYAPKVP